MTANTTEAAAPFADLFARDALNPAVAVVDGYGLHIRVERGHLHLTDGIGDTRRTRRYARTERTLRRVVVLGHTGSITLEALRWCSDVGISLAQLDTDGRLLTLSVAPGRDEPRLRRAQAAAPNTPVGLQITRDLLVAKVTGQAAVLDRVLNLPIPAARLRDVAAQIETAPHIPGCIDLESAAANTYFGAWAGNVRPQFTTQDTRRVPEHWRIFVARRSPIGKGRSPARAADPLNAVINYGYALAEAECRIALVTLGLDPGLGIAHTDRHARDSLALDLLEAIRPAVDTHVLTLICSHPLRAADFHETHDGNCRLMPPLTHQIAEASSTWAQTIAVHAEHIATALAASANGTVRIGTPLSGAQRRASAVGSAAARRERRTAQKTLGPALCRDCGTPLADARRTLCRECWPVHRRKLATELGAATQARRAEQTATGHDPAQTTEAKAARTAGRAARADAERTWDLAHPGELPDWEHFEAATLPALAGVPLSQMCAATGLSESGCSMIRSGARRPHPRHLPTLAALVE